LLRDDQDVSPKQGRSIRPAGPADQLCEVTSGRNLRQARDRNQLDGAGAPPQRLRFSWHRTTILREEKSGTRSKACPAPIVSAGCLSEEAYPSAYPCPSYPVCPFPV